MQAIASASVLDDGLPQGHLTIDGDLADDAEELDADRPWLEQDDL